MNKTRLSRVIANMEAQSLEQIVVTSTSSVYYLTGIHVEPMERMLALYIHTSRRCVLYASIPTAMTRPRCWRPGWRRAGWGSTNPGPANFSSACWRRGPTWLRCWGPPRWTRPG